MPLGGITRGTPQGTPAIDTSAGLTPQMAIVNADRTPTPFFFRFLLTNRKAAAAQTPWTSDIDAAGFKLGNLGAITFKDGTTQTTAYVPGTGGSVSSVFGRTGAIVAVAGDYTVAQVTGAVATARKVLSGAGLTGGGDLSADRTLAVIPATAGALGGVKIGANITVAGDGTISVAAPSGGGSQTPWTSNIDGGGFSLSNVSNITATGALTAASGQINGDLNVISTGAYRINGTVFVNYSGGARYLTVDVGTVGGVLSVGGAWNAGQQIKLYDQNATGRFWTFYSYGDIFTVLNYGPSNVFQITATTGGVQTYGPMKVGAGANIGTSAPFSTLHVVGWAAADQGSNIFCSIGTDVNGYAGSGITGGGFWYDTTNNAMRIGCLTGGVAYRPLVVNLNGGRVGIGIAAPLAILHINSATPQDGIVVDHGASKFSTFGINPSGWSSYLMGCNYLDQTNNVLRIECVQPGVAYHNVCICAAPGGTPGFVGIGTLTPSTPLHVLGTGADANVLIDVLASQTTYNSLVTFRQVSTAVWNIGMDTADANKLKFATGGAFDNLRTGALVTITPGGFFGIGTTTPSVALSIGAVLGDRVAVYDGGSGNRYGFGIQSGLLQIYAPNGGVRVGIGYGASAAFTETLSVTGGRVGVGTIAPGALLDVAGAILTSGASAQIQIGDQSSGHGPWLLFSASDALYFRNYGGSNIFIASGATGLVTFNYSVTVSGTLSVAGSFYTPFLEGQYVSSNAYYNGSQWIYRTNGPACILYTGGGSSALLQSAVSGTAGAAVTWATNIVVTSAATIIQNPVLVSPPSGGLDAQLSAGSLYFQVAGTNNVVYLRVRDFTGVMRQAIININ